MAAMFDRYNRPVGYGQPTVFKDAPKPEEPPGQPGRPPNQNLQNALIPNLNQPASPSLASSIAQRQTLPAGPPQQGPQTPSPQPQVQPYQPKGQALGFEGFDMNKAQAGHRSPKYNFRAAAQGLGYGDQDEILRRLKADDKEGYFANARFGGSKNDKLIIDGPLHGDFKGINTFDVFRAAGEGGKAFQWGAEGPNAGGSPQMPFNYASYAQQMPAADALSADDSDNFLQRLLAQLQQQQLR